MTNKVGLISMGQFSKATIKEDILAILEPGFEIVGVGILDKFSFDYIHEHFWPTAEESFIVSTIEHGRVVKLAVTRAVKLINEKIRYLENNGISCSLLMCTGYFQGIEHKHLLIEPQKVIRAALQALGVRKVGIVVPEQEQIDDSFKQYEAFNPIVVAASPYGDLKEIKKACAGFPTDRDMILLDCMGFTQKIKNIVAEITGKHIMLPRTLAASLLLNIG